MTCNKHGYARWPHSAYDCAGDEDAVCHLHVETDAQVGHTVALESELDLWARQNWQKCGAVCSPT